MLSLSLGITATSLGSLRFVLARAQAAVAWPAKPIMLLLTRVVMALWLALLWVSVQQGLAAPMWLLGAVVTVVHAGLLVVALTAGKRKWVRVGDWASLLLLWWWVLLQDASVRDGMRAWHGVSALALWCLCCVVLSVVSYAYWLHRRLKKRAWLPHRFMWSLEAVERVGVLVMEWAAGFFMVIVMGALYGFGQDLAQVGQAKWMAISWIVAIMWAALQGASQRRLLAWCMWVALGVLLLGGLDVGGWMAWTGS